LARPAVHGTFSQPGPSRPAAAVRLARTLGVMPSIRPPPPVLDSAQVIAYAVLDKSVIWTGRQSLFVDGEPLGSVPRLAICRNLFGDPKDYLIFHCDNRWNVLGIASAPTLRECKVRAENWYEGVSRCWTHTHTTKQQAEKWLRAECAGSACSFCARLPAETDGFFSKRGVNVCFTCVKTMHSALPNTTAAE
jgi:hypothetical protein